MDRERKLPNSLLPEHSSPPPSPSHNSFLDFESEFNNLSLSTAAGNSAGLHIPHQHHDLNYPTFSTPGDFFGYGAASHIPHQNNPTFSTAGDFFSNGAASHIPHHNRHAFSTAGAFSGNGAASTSATHAPPQLHHHPLINNYPSMSPYTLSNSWIERQAAAAPEYLPFDSQRLRANYLATMGSDGSYSGLGLGSGPSASFLDDPILDYRDLCDAVALSRRTMPAAPNSVNGGDYYPYSPSSAANMMINQFGRSSNPLHSLERFSILDHDNLLRGSRSPVVIPKNYISSNNRRRRDDQYRNLNNHYSDPYNCHTNGKNCLGGSSGSLSKTQLMEMKLPSWEDIRGSVATFAIDQKGSAILQAMVAQGQINGLDIAVSEVKQDVFKIITNHFGVHFFLKLVERCNDSQLYELLHSVMAVDNVCFLNVCLHPQGTHGVQKLVENMNKDDSSQKAILVSAIVPIALTLSKDNNGNYVMLAVLKSFQGVSDVIQPILEEIASDCIEICKHKSGCCTMQHCLSQPRSLAGHRRLLNLIVPNVYPLSEHEYGNYVVQYVLSMRINGINAQMYKNLEGSFAILSRNKHGSHVVERFLKDASNPIAERIIEELCNSIHFLEILQDSMGNFVAQTALHRSRAMGATRHYNHWNTTNNPMANKVGEYFAWLQTHLYGKKVLSHVKCKCKTDEYNVDDRRS